MTNPERLAHWFLPISGELKVGGRYQFKGNAGGKITHCEFPTNFSVTWEMQGDVSWVEVQLVVNNDNSCRLSLIHIVADSEFWTEYGPGATGVGWELGLVGLDLYLINPNEAKMDEAAFSSSTPGISFMTQSSEYWGKASISSGTDSVDALKAVQKTTAFYTGEV